MTETSHGPSRYESALKSLASGPLEIVLWSRGGPPGPSYTSDQLTISRQHGLITATYITARFDRRYDKNFRAIQYRATVSQQQIDEMLSAIQSDQIYDRHFAAEDRADRADGLKDSYTVTLNGTRFEKTVIQADDKEFAKTKAVRNTIVQTVRHTRDVTDLNRLLQE